MTLTTRYPLGLFRAWSYPHPAYACLVYPRPLDSPLPATAAISSNGHLHGARGQEDFTGLRLYQPHDSPRHIAWKAVARDIDQRPLLVKQFAGGTAEELSFDLDQTPPAAPLETRLSLLAGWLLTAERSGARYALQLPTRRLPVDQGPAHLHACLEALALHEPTD